MHGQRAKNSEKGATQRPLTVRWFGSPVRRLRGVLPVLLPWRVETSSFFTGIFRFVCYLLPPPPPQKKRPLGDPTIARPRSSMPPQGWSCWSRWWHTRTWRTYNLLSISRLHFIVRICQEKTSEMETSRPHCRSRAGWWWPIKTGLTSLSFKFTSSKYLKIMSFRDNKTHKFPTSLAAAVLPTAAAGAGLRWQQKKTTQHFPDKNHIKNRKTQQDSRNSRNSPQKWLDFCFGFCFWDSPTSKHRHLGLGWHWLDFGCLLRGFFGIRDPKPPSPELAPPNDLKYRFLGEKVKFHIYPLCWLCSKTLKVQASTNPILEGLPTALKRGVIIGVPDIGKSIHSVWPGHTRNST